MERGRFVAFVKADIMPPKMGRMEMAFCMSKAQPGTSPFTFIPLALQAGAFLEKNVQERSCSKIFNPSLC